MEEEEFLQLSAGIVLQSYLPDSYLIQKEITQWAQMRVQKGGAPIKIRLVKGANLAMEAVESSLYNWQQAPFENKIETDANFRRMLEYASCKQHAQVAHIGVGSHNLFDISYALLLRAENETENYISFEMLEGMAKPVQNVIKKLTGSLLIYCPEAKKKDFHTAVAYLIRRLDENCGAENFLPHLFEILPGNEIWKQQVNFFTNGCNLIEHLRQTPRRTQNRFDCPKEPKSIFFTNESDTDFSLDNNRLWANEIFKQWQNKIHAPIPLVIGGKEIHSSSEQGFDPSFPDVPLYFYSVAQFSLIEQCINCAQSSQSSWKNLPLNKRLLIFQKVAQIFRKKRQVLIGAMLCDTGKTVWESDPEISEAIDFIVYYSRILEANYATTDLAWAPKGTVLVAPPWNFPCSIPVSGISAALLAGNCVIFKPSPEAVLVGWHIAQAFWESGVPQDVLQFMNCKEDVYGDYLIKSPKINSVILTGSTSTAKKFLHLRPGLDLQAETGGKNAIIVTAMSDRDLAIRDIISSAFSHSGQKCSACSLVILEAEVFDDPHFKNQLMDAANSLKVASAWDRSAKITPLIRAAEEPLKRALTHLEEGETWLLQPHRDAECQNLWSPGIKWGSLPYSFTHQTELFGPVLGVMRARNLEEAIHFANATPYGLTSGLHSLDAREHKNWISKIIAGNLYINRSITGAIVSRQPFGGCKESSFGPGAKAGGPNYVHQFAIPSQVSLPVHKSVLPAEFLDLLIPILNTFQLSENALQIWKASAESYAYWAPILMQPTDISAVLGQANYFYHIPLEKAYVRIESQTSILFLLQVLAACLICKTPLEISSSFSLPALASISGICVYIEDELSFFNRKPSHVRLLTPPSNSLQIGASTHHCFLKEQPVLANGKFELLHYMREISLSINYHRYGYMGMQDYLLMFT